MQQQVITDPNQLREAWQAMLLTDCAPRQRDAAMLFGVSEAELVASQCGDRVTRLAPRWLDIVRALESLGRVMALTRNEYVVIEKDGAYRNIEAHGPMAQVVDEGIDLRVFLSRWSFGFALAEPGPRGIKRSLQFFDASGSAVHKVYMREHSEVAAYETLVATFRAAEQDRDLRVTPIPAEPTAADSDVEVAKLRARWQAMRDTHEFFGLLRDHRVTRLQALKLVGPPLAREVSRENFRGVLESAAESALSLMVFVGNRGCIEIHTGPIRRVVSRHGWLNVFDPGFNLHAREDGIASAWVVHKPSEQGLISSLEIFGPGGENIALLFADRKAGDRTVNEWKVLLRGLD